MSCVPGKAGCPRRTLAAVGEMLDAGRMSMCRGSIEGDDVGRFGVGRMTAMLACPRC